MKGVILAGGKGTRLRPVTEIINKHLLPVGNYPMIYWSINKLKGAGVKDVMIVTNQEDISDFFQLLGNGEKFGINICYEIQNRADGIADALSYAEAFVEDKFIVLLGDNIFEDSLLPFIESFKKQAEGAKILLKEVEDPERFGVAVLNQEKNLVSSIIEKPRTWISPYCVTGIYMYDRAVFDMIKNIKPSHRGELEITDVNNSYIHRSQMNFNLLNGWWIDAGTFDSLQMASRLVQKEFEVE
ncbi:sugar phosphate nucleotidyltransferase [Evansella halocellulosilytica]|uniref:sugar phosphate nucleotidyltransferase n=1 Tax=Evansella halocellulosilytica TaxID=2011013 RepID=UPI000BB73CE3|nr:sugar phosphate nucleotidyltransferase [Evansella halocellulosilytica]